MSPYRGLLVRGSNHWIVERTDGQQLPPTMAEAVALARAWTFVSVDFLRQGLSPQTVAASIGPWQQVNRAVRQELRWAIVVAAPASEGPLSPAVQLLLSELRERGIALQFGESFSPTS